MTEWAAGRGRLEELLREPQGRLSPLRNSAHNAPESGIAEAAYAEQAAETRAAVAGSAPATQGARPAEIADTQTLPLVRQQLALLQSGHFIWQGDAWPGQKMEWSVGERDADPEDATPGKKWSTRLKLDLPALGRVSAELQLKNGRLTAEITTDSSETAVLMREHEQRLREALSSSGITVAGMVVAHEE